MKTNVILLNRLLQKTRITVLEGRFPWIGGIAVDSRKVKPGDLFLAIPGGAEDGRQFVSEALQRGAVAVVAPSRISVPAGIALGVSPSIRKDLSILAANYYGNPGSQLKIFGITGTNGKTTTAKLLYEILRASGKECGLIGTLESRMGEQVWPATLTTPDPLQLQETLATFVQRGATHCVMEVSSQGLDQDRVHGLPFEVKVLTNVTSDHLDYHQNLENYRRVKRDWLMTGSAMKVVNLNDSTGVEIASKCRGVTTYALENTLADFHAAGVTENRRGLSFELHTAHLMTRLFIHALRGLFMVENVMAAVSAAYIKGISLEAILKALETFSPPRGRLSRVPGDTPFEVYIDYAHSPDGLQKVLETLRVATRGRLFVIFGCGGNRDQEKRSVMGGIAENFADHVILTTDNPRFENPEAIVMEILKGMRDPHKAHVLIDRRKAIEEVLHQARSGDVVCIAGKGHETYQEVQGKRTFFDDFNEVERFFNAPTLPGTKLCKSSGVIA